jgi:ribonuclease BN (tRNA processing enzyme)
MNEKIIMLGTGSAMVTDCYNTCFLLKSENDYLLVDAGGGNGILSAIKKSGIAWNSIKTMFITHSHTDHILGAVWVIRQISALMNSGKYEGNFNIYCHDECVDSITAICNHTLAPKFLKNINTKIFINEVKDGEKQNAGSIQLTFFDIFSDKTKQFGFKAVFILCVKLFVFTVKKIFLSLTKNSTAQRLMPENLQRVFLQKILSCITQRTKHFKHAKKHILQRQEQFLTEIYLFPMILKLLT